MNWRCVGGLILNRTRSIKVQGSAGDYPDCYDFIVAVRTAAGRSEIVTERLLTGLNCELNCRPVSVTNERVSMAIGLFGERRASGQLINKFGPSWKSNRTDRLLFLSGIN